MKRIILLVCIFILASCIDLLKTHSLVFNHDLYQIESYVGDEMREVVELEIEIPEQNLTFKDTLDFEYGFYSTECNLHWKREDIISIRKYRDLEIRKTKFIGRYVYAVKGFMWYEYKTVQFIFYADEVWEDGRRIMTVPHMRISKAGASLLEEVERKDDELAHIFINLDLRIERETDERPLADLPLCFDVVWLNKSDSYVNSRDITVTVTYDWHPENGTKATSSMSNPVDDIICLNTEVKSVKK